MSIRQIHSYHLRAAPFRRAVTATALGLLAALAAAPAARAADPVNATRFGHLAIEGYDPVAYFEQGAPAEGSEDHTFEWRGATWRFASAENRDLFAADPETYAPQYGGYCAYAVAKGATAKSEPDAWTIVEGKLFLNYDKNIQSRWARDISGNIADADKNWPGVIK